MKLYNVHLHMQLGEYEKTRRVLVWAQSKEDARTDAVRLECHNDPQWEDDNMDSAWDDTFLYSAGEVDEVDDSDVWVLKKYFFTYKLDQEENFDDE